MHHAEDNRLLHDGLYGSRPGRSALDPVFLDILQNEIYQCSMKKGIKFNLDATACYDRIIASVASLASRSIGMDKNVTKMNTITLEKAKFRLKNKPGHLPRLLLSFTPNPYPRNWPRLWKLAPDLVFHMQRFIPSLRRQSPWHLVYLIRRN